MITLQRGERQWLHVPFWGLGGSTPVIHVGSAVADMTPAPDFAPPAGWSAPPGVTGTASWFRVLLSTGLDDDPQGTIVVTAQSRMWIVIKAGDEIDIIPDHGEWVRVR